MTKTRSVRVRMLRLLRWRALTAAGALFLLVAASCVSIGPEQVRVSDIESTFPALTRLRVTAYRDQDWCKVLAYARGSFSETEFHSTCDLFDGPPSNFDSEARADFDRVQQMLTGAGISPYYVEIEYRDGAVQTAVFEVGCDDCDIGRYIYDAGGAASNSELGPTESQVILAPRWTWYEDH
jgi:hypothetical protein